ncbi:DUF2767 family protein [Rahnella perminowiae]
MCRIVGNVVFTLHDSGIESKSIVIADVLRNALTGRPNGQRAWFKP